MPTIVSITRIVDRFNKVVTLMAELSDGNLLDVWAYYYDYPNLAMYAWSKMEGLAVGTTVDVLRERLFVEARPN